VGDGLVKKVEPVEFTWGPVADEIQYRLEVFDSANDERIYNAYMELNTHSVPLSAGSYNWRIRGNIY
jgi:hypothetical protein